MSRSSAGNRGWEGGRIVEHNVDSSAICVTAPFSCSTENHCRQQHRQPLADRRLTELFLERKSLTSQHPNLRLKTRGVIQGSGRGVQCFIAVRRGSRVGIFGHNGSGKSTFLKCLIGGVKTVSGTVHFGEALIRPDFVHVNVRLGISRCLSRAMCSEPHRGARLRIAGLRANNTAFEQVFVLPPKGAPAATLGIDERR